MNVFLFNKLNVTSLALSPTLFNLLCLSCSKCLFLCLDSFIVSLCVACLPVCVKIVQTNNFGHRHYILLLWNFLKLDLLF